MENIVKVYITDISNKSLQPQKYDLLEVNRKENIITAKNYLYRLRSMCAGLLLRHALISEGCEVNGVLDVKYTDKGKPYIENGKKFSISHSGNIVIVAVSDFEVGVDAEICQNKVYSHIASKVLSPNEFIEYDKLVGVDKITYFLTHWVVKEGYLKLKGTGLNGYPSNVDVLNDTVNGCFFNLQTITYKKYIYHLAVVQEKPFNVEFSYVTNLKV